jgi:hypothetical protein
LLAIKEGSIEGSAGLSLGGSKHVSAEQELLVNELAAAVVRSKEDDKQARVGDRLSISTSTDSASFFLFSVLGVVLFGGNGATITKELLVTESRHGESSWIVILCHRRCTIAHAAGSPDTPDRVAKSNLNCGVRVCE